MPNNISSKAPMKVGGSKIVPAGSIATSRTESTALKVQDLDQMLASSRKQHLPECKPAQYNGELPQWHEWFGQFKSAIDTAPLMDDVKLTFLKTLVTGKSKRAIAEFVFFCGALYKDILRLKS